MDFWGESHIWVESICTYTIIFQISSIVFDESCSLVFPSSPSCRLQVFPWSIHAGLEPMCKQKPSWMLLLCCIIFAYLSSPSQSTFLLVMPDVATQIWGPKSEVAQALSRLRDPKVLGCLRIRVLETQYGWAKAKVANFRSIGLGDASTKKVTCLERHVNFTMKFWPKGKYVWWNRHHVFGGWNVGGRKSDHNNLLWFKLWGPKQNCHTSLR